eukprot:2379013-Rhodomonas_salina.2
MTRHHIRAVRRHTLTDSHPTTTSDTPPRASRLVEHEWVSENRYQVGRVDHRGRGGLRNLDSSSRHILGRLRADGDFGELGCRVHGQLFVLKERRKEVHDAYQASIAGVQTVRGLCEGVL